MHFTQFVKAESSEKLRIALRKKTRNWTSKIFEHGDSVYYKKNDSLTWKGPGTVVGKEGTCVIIRHGGTITTVPTCRVRLENSEFLNGNETDVDHRKHCRGEVTDGSGDIDDHQVHPHPVGDHNEDNTNIVDEGEEGSSVDHVTEGDSTFDEVSEPVPNDDSSEIQTRSRLRRNSITDSICSQ